MSGVVMETNNDKTLQVKDYDFRAPKKFTKERIKILDSIFDNYARLLSSYLTGLLRLYCKVSLASIEEQRYFEFNNALPDYVMMGTVDLGIHDDDIPWARDAKNPFDNKYFYVCHAEFNAILNSNAPVRNCKLYVTLFPCNECAKAIIQSGITEVIYYDDKYADSDSIRASKRMFDLAGVKYRKYESRKVSLFFKGE